jgi:AcrR family transcriptional regulator
VDGGASRDRLVRAGIELILEHHRNASDPREVFAFLTPGAVAERAGVSRGLIYHHWSEAGPDGADPFTRFLVSVTEQMWEDVTVPEDLAELADLLPDNISDVISILSSAELDRMSGADREMGRAILVLSMYGIGSAENTERAVDRLEGLYGKIFAKLGIEPVPPLEVRDVALAIMCVLDGFTVNQPALGDVVSRAYDWQPEVPGSGSGNRWTLFGIAVESIALNMTRPIATSGA